MVLAWLHDCCFSWSHVQGLRWRHCCSCRTLLGSVWTSYFYHSCNRLFLFPSKHCNQDIAVWKNFRKVRRSPCGSSRRLNPAILCWTFWSSASVSSPEWIILFMFVVLELLDQLLDFNFACCILRLDCRKVFHVFCDPRCCYRFRHNFSIRSMVSKMILLLGFVDFVDHIVSSILARLVAFSELSAPSGRAHPAVSYIPLSQCKLQAVCCCMWPCLAKLQAFLLSELQIAPKYCILIALPSILVWRDPWFRTIAWSFPHAIYVFHRAHRSEEDRFSSSLDAFSSWN